MKLLSTIALCLSILTTSCDEEVTNQLFDCSTALSEWIVDMNITVTSFSCRQDDEQCFCNIYIGNRHIPVDCYKNQCYFE